MLPKAYLSHITRLKGKPLPIVRNDSGDVTMSGRVVPHQGGTGKPVTQQQLRRTGTTEFRDDSADDGGCWRPE